MAGENMNRRGWFAAILKHKNCTYEQAVELTKKVLKSEYPKVSFSISSCAQYVSGIKTPSVPIAKAVAEALEFEKFGYDWTQFYEEEQKGA